MARKKVTGQTKAQNNNQKNKVIQKISKPDNRRKPKNKKDQQQQQQNIQLPEVGQQESSISKSEQNPKSESNSENESGSGQSEDSGSGQEDSQQESSITPIKPQNYAVKQMQFRERRGTKMNYLMNRKKQQEEDSFWAEHKGLFGDLNGPDDQEDQEDYVQSSSGKDQFDSDFGQTESQHNDEPPQDQKKMVDEFDQQKQKQKKRRAELMKRVNAPKEKPEINQKEKEKITKAQNSHKLEKPREQKQIKKQTNNTQNLKKTKLEQKTQQQIGNRFIHQIFTQQQLLGEAAHTQYYNWLSLKKLISIQTEKKDFTRKVKHVDGNKVIYKNKLNQDGSQFSTYELCGVSVSNISDLTNYWQAK